MNPMNIISTLSKFSPGPWEILRSKTHGTCWIEDESGRSIVDLYHYYLRESTPERPVCCVKANAEANAHLIVAAPVMFEALSGMVSYLYDDSENSKKIPLHLWNKINDALSLALAIGEDPIGDQS